jgi:hypothetical protein
MAIALVLTLVKLNAFMHHASWVPDAARPKAGSIKVAHGWFNI